MSSDLQTAKASSVRWRQFVVIGLLMTGYSGYYLCRSNLSVSLPLLIQEMSTHGIPSAVATVRLGGIASIGVLVYAIGKFPSGGLADFLGGRRNFLMGMAGAVLFTLLFAWSTTIPLFTLAWVGNRCFQSLGWAGLVKITSKWFSFSSYGAVMGIISLSYLFGDALSRQFMGILIAHGFGWRGVFVAAGSVLGLLLVANLLFLRESPKLLGLPEPEVNPLNLFEAAGRDERPQSVGSLLRAFSRSRPFWLVCLLSLGVTLVRETFNLWTPTFFSQSLGMSNADAAQKSALFPLFGGVSVILAGFISDRLGRNGRASIILVGLALCSVALFGLAAAAPAGISTVSVWLTALIGFMLIGPYSYLAGAIALDFGGKQGSATASGFIDGIGYLGGVLAGNSIASVAVRWGWQGAFVMLGCVCALSAGAAAVYWVDQRRTT